MALTSAEEEKVKAIIKAFDSGKKVSDLPLATGGIEDYTVEVLDGSGESRKLPLYSAISNVNKKMAVRRWNETTSSPVGEAWGNIDYLRDLPGELGLGCYLVTDDRKRRKLDPTNHYRFQDGSPALLDGTMGQYMWCWNAHYFAFWKEGNYMYEAVSTQPIDGKECYFIPAGGVSALGAGVMDRTTSTLCSLISDDVRYRGGNNNAALDGTYKTMIGMPVTNIAYGSFSTLARKRGEGWEAGWYVARAVCEYLFRIIMGTRHSQTAVNPNRDVNGLYQGGLGTGVTAIASAAWNTFNAYYPLIPTSAGVELGDSVGEASYNVLNEDKSVLYAAKIPVFFGLKHLYGNLWQAINGLLIDAAEKSTIYVAPSLYDNYNKATVAGLLKCGEMPQNEAYIKKVMMHKLCCMPSEVGGSASTYFADNSYCNHTTSKGLRCRLAGGSSYNGAAAGAFVSNSNYAVTTTSTLVSSPLCFFEQDPIIS